MAERNYQFRERMLEVHRPNRRMSWVEKKDGQIEITSDWTIYITDTKDPVIYNAARDLEDYLAVSMNVCVRFKIGGDIPAKAIVYSVDPSLGENEYRFAVAEDRIDLCGSDARSAAQAGYFAEDLMNLCEAPFINLMDEVRKPLYSPRMIHSGYGLHMRNIAHAGINALLIFVEDIDMTPHGYQDFNNLIYRAAQWGIDVYAYSYMISRVYPEGE